MQITVPDKLVKRTIRAANWQYGKDTPETQIAEILKDFCDRIEEEREKEEAKINETLAARKKLIARYEELVKASSASNTYIHGIPKCRVYLTDGTDRIVYGLFSLLDLGYMAFSDPERKKPAPIVPGLMNTWEEE